MLLKPFMNSTLISKVGIGSVQFGLDYGISNKKGITNLKEVRLIVRLAREVGINLIDTAYGYGKSQDVLGKVGVNDFNVVSKFLPDSYGLSIKNQLESSLKSLKTTKLYGFLAHRPLDVINKKNIWPYLIDLKKAGVIQKAGISFNTPEEIYQVLSKGYIPDLIQVPYNYFDNRFRTIMIDLKNCGCEIHSRSAFLQGLFFIPPDELGDHFNEAKPYITELQKNKENLPRVLLKFCLQQPFIDKVIVGVNNLAQLLENISDIEIQDDLPEFKNHIDHKILTPSEWPKTN